VPAERDVSCRNLSKTAEKKFLRSKRSKCIYRYQNAQITITSTGYASTSMVISTHTGIFWGPLLVLYKSAGYQYVQITSTSIWPERGGVPVLACPYRY
jgi:hypothetical protein